MFVLTLGFLLSGGLAAQVVVVGGAVVHLDVLHRIGRQALECYLGVSGKEVLAVHHQTLNKLAVHLDLSVLQFRAGKLGYQRIQHGTLGQLKGGGIVHDGIAA